MAVAYDSYCRCAPVWTLDSRPPPGTKPGVVTTGDIRELPFRGGSHSATRNLRILEGPTQPSDNMSLRSASDVAPFWLWYDLLPGRSFLEPTKGFKLEGPGTAWNLFRHFGPAPDADAAVSRKDGAM